MDEDLENIIDSLFERWIEEFGRAVEMFTGDTPVISFSQTTTKAAAEIVDSFTWWKQVFEGRESFAVWVGGPEATVTALGGALADGSDPKEMLFEMMTQANQGSAAVLTAAFPTPVRCLDGVSEAPALKPDFSVARIKVKFRDTELEPLYLLVEAAATRVLSPPVAEKNAVKKEVLAIPAATSAMLDRLMDLKLPVSVLLGKAVVSIRDVLKITSGSLIELDRQIGDHVEIIVHGTVVAKGEIVSVKGNYGVRIKEVISRQDRIALHEAA